MKLTEKQREVLERMATNDYLSIGEYGKRKRTAAIFSKTQAPKVIHQSTILTLIYRDLIRMASNDGGVEIYVLTPLGFKLSQQGVAASRK